jgi:flagellar capping protein FliD
MVKTVNTSVNERLGIVETKVENLNEKLDELKYDIKDMHDCLDKTRDNLTDKLDMMYHASCTQHNNLSQELEKLKTQRDKAIWIIGGGIAVLVITTGHFDKILTIFKAVF